MQMNVILLVVLLKQAHKVSFVDVINARLFFYLLRFYLLIRNVYILNDAK